MFSTFHIDPAYLRFVYDGLQSGGINKDSLNDLPNGLAGMYDDAIPPKYSVRDREKFLSFFTVWSLLKKEVSPTLIADLLNWREQEVIDYLSIYTKWFNSPVSGRYLLYHERLRVFLLGKISPHQLDRANQSIRSKCQMAIERQEGGEWEVYALEYLPAHLLILAMQHEQDSGLYKKLVYDTTFWSRQLEISKGFDWTKKMLSQAMGWAAKQNTDELVEWALNKVDLHHMEQNDAPRIVELVAQNDIDTALRRIENFGGSNREGIHRKFILYILCLMELTFHGSKDKKFSRDAIEKILNHFNANIPSDNSIFDWNEYVPIYLIYILDLHWKSVGINQDIFQKRTINVSQFEGKGKLEVKYQSLLQITDQDFKCWLLKDLLVAHYQKNRENYASRVLKIILFSIDQIPNKFQKCLVIKNIYIRIKEKIQYEKVEALQNKFLIECSTIGNSSEKEFLKIQFQSELSSICQKENYLEYHTKLLTLAKAINNPISKTLALLDLSTKAFLCGDRQNALERSNQIYALVTENTTWNRYYLFSSYALELLKQNNTKNIDFILDKIETEWIDESTGAVVNKASLLKDIMIRMVIGEDFNAVYMFLIKHLNKGRGIKDEQHQREILCQISNASAEKCHIGIDSLIYLDPTIDIYKKYISNVLNTNSAEVVCEMAKQVSCDKTKPDAFKRYFSKSLAKSVKIEEALACARGISSDRAKSSALKDIGSELTKQGYVEESASAMQEALACARGISDESEKSSALKDISAELVKQGHVEESASAMQEALACARGIRDDYWKSSALKDISAELVKQGHVEEALACARGISDDYWKSSALKDISAELVKQGHVEEALACACGISDDYWKSSALKDISAELVKQGHVEEALVCARGISDDYWKSNALKDISAELVKQGHVEESASGMQEALACARGISDDFWKSNALKDICIELAKKGDWTLLSMIRIEISQIDTVQSIWVEIAKNSINELGWKKALSLSSMLPTDENRMFFLEGLIKKIDLKDVDPLCVQESLSKIFNDNVSIEIILQKYAINSFYFGTCTEAHLHRLNKALNIQWAIDISTSIKRN